MEMTPDGYQKYLAKYGSPTPKQGRYAPHGEFFQCANAEQVRVLEEAGWTDSPLKFTPPYKPEKARWIEKWDDVHVTVEPAAPVVAQPSEADALREKLAAAQAELDALKAAKKPGPKPKLAA